MSRQRRSRVSSAPSRSRDVDSALPTALHLPLTLAIGGFAVLRILGAVPGLPLPWGLRINAVLPPVWTLLFLLPLLLVLLPSPFRASTSTAARGSAWSILLGVGLAGLAASAAWILPVAFAFLGDGSLYVGEVYRASVTEGYAGMLIKPTAWLTGYLLLGMAHLISPEQVRLPFLVLSSLAGFATVGGLWIALKKENHHLRLLLYALLFGMGGTLFFFGYLELYPLAYAVVLLHLGFLWKAVKHDSSLLPSFLLLLLACSLSAVAFVFLPGWVFAVLRRSSSLPSRLRHPLPIIGAMFVVLLLAVLLNPFPRAGVLIPPFPAESWDAGKSFGVQGYTLFSGAHLRDLPSSYLLATGLAGLLILVLPLVLRNRTLPLRPLSLVLTVSVAGGVLFVGFGNTYLGQGRDWDVVALALAAVPFLATSLISDLEVRYSGLCRRLLPSVIATGAVAGATWIVVQTSESASARWFASHLHRYEGVILSVDQYTGYDHLLKFAKATGNQDEGREILWLMDRGGHARVKTWRALLQDVMDAAIQGLPLQRNPHFERLMARMRDEARSTPDPQRSSTVSDQDFREFLVRVLSVAHTLGAGEDAARQASEWGKEARLRVWPERALWDAQRGIASLTRDSVESLATTCGPHLHDPYLLMVLGDLFRKTQAFEEAARWMEKAISMAPKDYASWYLVLAGLYLDDLKDPIRARAVLDRCLIHCPSSPEAQTARQVLSGL